MERCTKVIVNIILFENCESINIMNQQLDFMFPCHLCLEEYELVAERKECAGAGINGGNLASISECASSCRNTASMFIFGTNDYEAPRCNGNYGDGLCACWCEPSATNNGYCDMVTTDGYRLYKFASSGR